MATQKTCVELWIICILPINMWWYGPFINIVSWKNPWILTLTEFLTPSKWSLCSHTETRGGGTGDRARMERSTATRLCQALNTGNKTHCPDAEMGVAWCGLAIARCVFGVYRGYDRHWQHVKDCERVHVSVRLSCFRVLRRLFSVGCLPSAPIIWLHVRTSWAKTQKAKASGVYTFYVHPRLPEPLKNHGRLLLAQ